MNNDMDVDVDDIDEKHIEFSQHDNIEGFLVWISNQKPDMNMIIGYDIYYKEDVERFKELNIDIAVSKKEHPFTPFIPFIPHSLKDFLQIDLNHESFQYTEYYDSLSSLKKVKNIIFDDSVFKFIKNLKVLKFFYQTILQEYGSIYIANSDNLHKFAIIKDNCYVFDSNFLSYFINTGKANHVKIENAEDVESLEKLRQEWTDRGLTFKIEDNIDLLRHYFPHSNVEMLSGTDVYVDREFNSVIRTRPGSRQLLNFSFYKITKLL